MELLNDMTKSLASKSLASRLKNLITVRDIFYIFIGFVLAGVLALYAFNFYMSSAIKVSGLVFQNNAYSLQVRPSPVDVVSSGEGK